MHHHGIKEYKQENYLRLHLPIFNLKQKPAKESLSNTISSLYTAFETISFVPEGFRDLCRTLQSSFIKEQSKPGMGEVPPLHSKTALVHFLQNFPCMNLQFCHPRNPLGDISTLQINDSGSLQLPFSTAMLFVLHLQMTLFSLAYKS